MRENQLAQLVARNTKATRKIPYCVVAVAASSQDEEHPTLGSRTQAPARCPVEELGGDGQSNRPAAQQAAESRTNTSSFTQS